MPTKLTEEPSEWIPLFNGHDLTGWLSKINGYPLGENYANTFRVEENILKISYDQYDAYGTKYGHLFYRDSFSHYRLKVEYRFVGEQAPSGPDWGFKDGGVEYHCQPPQSMALDQGFPVCVEANLHGGNGSDDRPTGQLCSPGSNVVIEGQLNTQHCIPIQGTTFHGEEWVLLEIEVHGADSIKHFINGQEVVRYEKPQLDPNDEYATRMIRENPTIMTGGWIALQSNSHPMEFRQIELLPLN